MRTLIVLQGMSDLLSVVLLVTTDETEAFWIFERLMHRVGGNFDSDQACCQSQLRGLSRLVQLLDPPLHAAIRAAGATDYLFAFRWIMVLLKREFLLSEVLSCCSVFFSCAALVYEIKVLAVHARQERNWCKDNALVTFPECKISGIYSKASSLSLAYSVAPQITSHWFESTR